MRKYYEPGDWIFHQRKCKRNKNLRIRLNKNGTKIYDGSKFKR